MTAEIRDTEIRETVRARYAAAAREATAPTAQPTPSARSAPPDECSDGSAPHPGQQVGPDPWQDANGQTVFGRELYDSTEAAGAAEALEASLGCGVPTAVADLHPGEVVLDLGSGAGGDVLISAQRVTPGGRAIGLDMTAEMVDLARRHAAEAGVDNVEFVQGFLEDIPLPEGSVDVVISNCVINLAADKALVLREASRVLRPGGRFAVSDVLADADMDEATRVDMQEWTGCIAGALTEPDYTRMLAQAGFTDIEIRRTHRVHPRAEAAIVRASRPLR